MSSRRLIGDSSQVMISPNSKKTCRMARTTYKDKKHFSPQRKKCTTLPCLCRNNREICPTGKSDPGKVPKCENFSEFYRQKMVVSEQDVKTHVFLEDETTNQAEYVNYSPVSTLTTWGSCTCLIKNSKNQDESQKEQLPVLNIIRRAQSVPCSGVRMNFSSSANTTYDGASNRSNATKRSSSCARRKLSPNRKPFLPAYYHQSKLGQLTWRQKSPEKLLFRAEHFSDTTDDDEEKSLSYPHRELSGNKVKSIPRVWTGPRLSNKKFKEIKISDGTVRQGLDFDLIVNPDRIALFDVVRSNKRNYTVEITPMQGCRSDGVSARSTFPIKTDKHVSP